MSTTKPYKKHLFERLQTHEEMIGYLLAAHAEGSDVFALAVKDVAASAREAGASDERKVWMQWADVLTGQKHHLASAMRRDIENKLAAIAAEGK